MPGRITLLGSGELMSAMSRVHRSALAALSERPRPVFLDVTAGFETNVDAISEKAVEYYQHHLGTELAVARYRHRDASAAEVAAAVEEVRRANFIFAGPGSPTYTVKHLRDTPVWQTLRECMLHGAHALFASAASIAMGKYALPVYELFKVGEDPFWAEGLDYFGELGLKLAIVPHFDESSGGDNYDSRFCYVGAKRFDALQELLPPDVTILGIDGYTAVSFDPDRQVAVVSGQGAVTTLGDGEIRRWTAGEEVPFASFSAGARQVVRTQAEEPPRTGYEFADGARVEDSFDSLVALIEDLEGLSQNEKIAVLGMLQAVRGDVQQGAGSDAALMDLVVELRQYFRNEKRFDIADTVRQRLGALGYEIHDNPEGSSWARQP